MSYIGEQKSENGTRTLYIGERRSEDGTCTLALVVLDLDIVVSHEHIYMRPKENVEGKTELL
jgi:hypothetical protein